MALAGTRSLFGRYLLGVANGFLPCGPVYTVALTAAATGSAAKGALAMLFFGLGTVPVLLALGLGAARLSLNIVTYLAGLGVFMSIYETKARSLFSSTAIGLTALLLSLELLRGAQDDAGRTWLYALSVGAIMGELTWALNYWGIGGAMGGVFLLLAFYLLTGLCQSYFRGRLSRRVAIEFAAVAAIGLGLLGRYSPWAW